MANTTQNPGSPITVGQLMRIDELLYEQNIAKKGIYRITEILLAYLLFGGLATALFLYIPYCWTENFLSFFNSKIDNILSEYANTLSTLGYALAGTLTLSVKKLLNIIQKQITILERLKIPFETIPYLEALKQISDLGKEHKARVIDRMLHHSPSMAWVISRAIVMSPITIGVMLIIGTVIAYCTVTPLARLTPIARSIFPKKANVALLNENDAEQHIEALDRANKKAQQYNTYLLRAYRFVFTFSGFFDLLFPPLLAKIMLFGGTLALASDLVRNTFIPLIIYVAYEKRQLVAQDRKNGPLLKTALQCFLLPGEEVETEAHLGQSHIKLGLKKSNGQALPPHAARHRQDPKFRTILQKYRIKLLRHYLLPFNMVSEKKSDGSFVAYLPKIELVSQQKKLEQLQEKFLDIVEHINALGEIEQALSTFLKNSDLENQEIKIVLDYDNKDLPCLTLRFCLKNISQRNVKELEEKLSDAGFHFDNTEQGTVFVDFNSSMQKCNPGQLARLSTFVKQLNSSTKSNATEVPYATSFHQQPQPKPRKPKNTTPSHAEEAGPSNAARESLNDSMLKEIRWGRSNAVFKPNNPSCDIKPLYSHHIPLGRLFIRSDLTAEAFENNPLHAKFLALMETPTIVSAKRRQGFKFDARYFPGGLKGKLLGEYGAIRFWAEPTEKTDTGEVLYTVNKITHKHR